MVYKRGSCLTWEPRLRKKYVNSVIIRAFKTHTTAKHDLLPLIETGAIFKH